MVETMLSETEQGENALQYGWMENPAFFSTVFGQKTDDRQNMQLEVYKKRPTTDLY